MSVVCKMQCHAVPQGEEITDYPQAVVFGAVWIPDEDERSKPENAVFGKATPWGDMKLGIANPAAKEWFKPGKKYHVTFTEAPD
jgi:hypothetical protein